MKKNKKKICICQKKVVILHRHSENDTRKPNKNTKNDNQNEYIFYQQELPH